MAIADNQVVSHFFSKPNLIPGGARWLEILAYLNNSALWLQPGRINVLDNALSQIRHVAPKLKQSHATILSVSDDDLLRCKLEDSEGDQLFGVIYRCFDN